MDDEQEIISRPPSHPIATTLLLASIAGTIVSTAFVWAELFGEYLPTPGPGKPNASLKIAERHEHDHYRVDYGASEDLQAEIEKELKIATTVGDVGDDG